jgi:ankyrin repeat protein
LAFAYRPLSIDEISEVIAIDVDRDPAFDRDEVLEDPMDTLDICSSLVNINDEFGDDNAGRTNRMVMLAHYSVKEYLLLDRIRNGPAAHYSMNPSVCHGIIARACLGYLLQFQKSDPISHNQDLVDSKLARYCAKFWMRHAKESDDREAETARLAARLMSTSSPTFVNWTQIYDPEYDIRTPTELLNKVSAPLFYATLFGLEELARLLRGQSADTNAQGSQSLQVASVFGHERTVRLLLARGVDIIAYHGKYGNALQAACLGGHEDIVKLLIKSGANVNAPGLRLYLHTSRFFQINLELTALNSASGYFEIAELLINSGADINHASPSGWTPLHLASYNGHVDFVKLLLSRGANPRTADRTDGHTPLMAAVHRGHLDVVKTLLDVQEVDVNVASKKGETALMWALSDGRYELISLLLEYGAHIEHQDGSGETIFSKTAHSGSKNVFKALFATSKMEPDYRDHYGRTLLWWAAAGGNKPMIETLLNEYHCDLNIPDKCGRRPILVAARNGHRAAVEFLLQVAQTGTHHPTQSEQELLDLSGRERKLGYHLMCDICAIKFPAENISYHCLLCHAGDWDMCVDCKVGGMACMGNTHVLVKRLWRNGRWNEVG